MGASQTCCGRTRPVEPVTVPGIVLPQAEAMQDPVSTVSMAGEKVEEKEKKDTLGGKKIISIFVKEATVPENAKNYEICLSASIIFGPGGQGEQKQQAFGKAGPKEDKKFYWERKDSVVTFDERFDFIFKQDENLHNAIIKLSFNEQDGQSGENSSFGIAQLTLPEPTGPTNDWNVQDNVQMNDLDNCMISYEYCWRNLDSRSRRDKNLCKYAEYRTFVVIEVTDTKKLSVNISRSAYCHVQFNNASFKTKKLGDEKRGWKQRCYFWLTREHVENQKDFSFKFDIKDADKGHEIVATGVYEIERLRDGQRKRSDIVDFGTEKGKMNVIIRLARRKHLEQRYYRNMYNFFQEQLQNNSENEAENKDISLNPTQVAYLVGLASGNVPQSIIDWILSQPQDQVRNKNLMRFLRRAQSILLIGIPLFVFRYPSRIRIKGGCATQALMDGFELITVRKKGNDDEEKVPNYIYGALKAMKNNKEESITLLSKVSKATIFGNDSENDPQLVRMNIKTFMKLYGLKFDNQKGMDNYNSFNEYFAREKKPVELKKGDEIICSPADCRVIAFKSIDSAKQIWIKGNKFSVKELLRGVKDVSQYENGALCICRLSPYDSHSFYLPVNAKKVTEVKFDNRSTNVLFPTVPDAVQDIDANVYTENERKILQIETPGYGIVYCVVIGSVYIGSIEFESTLPNNKGEKVGKFQYGGSTILLLFKADLITFDNMLKKNSEEGVETYMQMGNTIGRLADQQES